MNTNDNGRDYAVREFTDNELDAVDGGALPIAPLVVAGVWAAVYVAGTTAALGNIFGGGGGDERS